MQNKGLSDVLTAAGGRVDWAYEGWDEALKNLKHKDNHNGAIAAQVLRNACRPCGKSAQRA